MEKRMLLALVLILLLFWINSILFPPPPETTSQETPARESAEGPAGESVVDESGEATPPAEGDGAPPEDDPAAPPAFETSAVEDENSGITIESDLYRAVFSNRGGVLRSLKLKRHFNDPEVQQNPDWEDDPEKWYEILAEVCDDTPSFVLRKAGKKGDPGVDLAAALWEWEEIVEHDGSRTVRFVLKCADGLILTKSFSFYDGAYHIDFNLDVENRNPALTGMQSFVMDALSGIMDTKRAAWTVGPTAILLIPDPDNPEAEPEILDKDSDELVDKKSFTYRVEQREDLRFAGLVTNYFALLLKPVEGNLLSQVSFYPLEDSGRFREAVDEFRREYGAEPIQSTLDKFHHEALTNVSSRLVFDMRTPAVGDAKSQSILFFAGPRESGLMQQEPYSELYTLIEDSYGSMSWINKGLVAILKFFQSIFGNWGVAIICLTLLVKALLFPLSRVQQVSMHRYSQKMGKLKPKLDELRKRHKNNKKKFNEEQMKLMKEHGATPPLLGCLLIFLQFPIFIGLFQVLRTSIELRHSPFMLWIKDLSMPDQMPLPFALPFIGDTINLLPLLMVVAFFLQQKVMPKPADPQQAQTQKIMMYFMPIFFGFLFYGYASGLSLYWMTSNIISIVETQFIRKKFPVGGETKAEEPAATPKKEPTADTPKKPKGPTSSKKKSKKR